MAAPADPRFATDAAFAADGDIWASDPNKADPGAPRIAEGFEPDTVPAEWLNWQLNLLGAWAFYIGESASRVIRLSPWSSFPMSAAVGDAPTWIGQVFSTNPTQGFNLASGSDSARLMLPISDLIPDGSIVTKVRAIVRPGAVRAVASPPTYVRMNLSIMEHEIGWTAGPPPTSAFVGGTPHDEDNGAIEIQFLDTGTISRTVNRAAEQLVAFITAGDTAGTDRDRVYAWEITYTGPKVFVEG